MGWHPSVSKFRAMPEVVPLGVGVARGGVEVHSRHPSSPELFMKPSKLFPLPYHRMARHDLGRRRGGLMTKAKSYRKAIDKEIRKYGVCTRRVDELQRVLNVLQARILDVDLYLRHGTQAADA